MLTSMARRSFAREREVGRAVVADVDLDLRPIAEAERDCVGPMAAVDLQRAVVRELGAHVPDVVRARARHGGTGDRDEPEDGAGRDEAERPPGSEVGGGSHCLLLTGPLAPR
jgi:hypothetical protein